MDNQDVAIMTKLNELAERHGVKAYDFNADVKYDDKSQKTVLRFLTAESDAEEKVDKMIDSIAGSSGMRDGTLAGTTKEIIDALDAALHVAPKPRTFGR